MPLVCYREKNFSVGSQDVIAQATDIIDEYQAQGFDLTLRQLYYQFVARDLIPNNMRSYKRLGSIINDARLAGLIDWEAIEDRTRFVRRLAHWSSPKSIVDSCVESYRINKWRRQPYHVEVWIEKDALVGVIAGVCDELDVPYLACRGYLSQSEQWAASQRFNAMSHRKVMIFHLGDHDPSGIDMTRDNRDRLHGFWSHHVEVRRLALNMDQVEEHTPPPNPAKITDSRAEGYIERFGPDSWELDALEPAMMEDLIRDNILAVRDDELWETAEAEEDEGRERLRELAGQM